MLPRPDPRDAFRRELRGRLMAEARVALAPRETAWTALRRTWLRPALALAAIGLFLLGGSGLAAAGSLPGDPAFALKRAVEDIQLALAPDEGARISVLAAQADHRLAELSTATSERPAAAPTASAAYADAVARLSSAIDALRGTPGAGERTVEAARDVADRAGTKHLIVLDELEQRAPEKARDAIEQAKHEAEKLRPTGNRGPANGPGAGPTRTPERTTPERSPERSQGAPASATARPPDDNGDHDGGEAARSAAPAATLRPTETRRPSPSPSSSPRR